MTHFSVGFHLIKNHNLLENLLLFLTEITNLLFVIKNRQPLEQNFVLNCKRTTIKKKEYKKTEYNSTERYLLLGNPLIFSTQNPDFICRQRTENQKLYIEKNVMSEQVKMPVRHFLRRDYLHIFFYIKFLVFVSLVHQIRI